VPRRALEQMIADSPALERRLMQQTLKELDQARNWTVTLGRKSAQEKAAKLLDLIATQADPTQHADQISFDLPLSRADIAVYSSGSPSRPYSAADDQAETDGRH